MHRRMLLLVTTVVALAVVSFVSFAGAAQPKCLIVNLGRDGVSYSTLQAAQDAAKAGDRLKLKGTCYGTTTISKNLAVVGQSNPAFGTPTLDGGNIGSVVSVSLGVHVTINDLTITHGSADFGGGILNLGGTVTLNGRSSVTGNTAGFGGGILNRLGGTVTLNGRSSVTGNSATVINGTGGDGGGINNFGFNEGGSVTLNGRSSVSGNTAASTGGGIFNNVGNTLTLNDNSTVEGNIGVHAGGIWNDGTVTLNDSSTVMGNSVSTGLGGGIFNIGTVTLHGDASITANTAGFGGGIFNFGAVTLDNSSSITDNTAILGGGIWNNGAVTLNDSSSVTGNSPDNCEPLNTIPGCIN